MAGACTGSGKSPGTLLACASHVVVPVHKRTLRVGPPSPDVKLEERRYVVSVRAIDEQKSLTLQNGGTGVIFQPCRCIHDEFDAHQTHLTVGGLIDQGLGVRGIDGSIEQAGIDVVYPHSAVV